MGHQRTIEENLSQCGRCQQYSLLRRASRLLSTSLSHTIRQIRHQKKCANDCLRANSSQDTSPIATLVKGEASVDTVVSANAKKLSVQRIACQGWARTVLRVSKCLPKAKPSLSLAYL